MAATTTERVQEQMLGAVRKGQAMTLDAIKKVTETVSAAQAKLPTAPFDGKRPALPFADKLPGLSSLPKPEAVVSSAFDFLGHFLAEQRKFADELVKATAALRPGAEAKPADAKPADAEPAGAEAVTEAPSEAPTSVATAADSAPDAGAAPNTGTVTNTEATPDAVTDADAVTNTGAGTGATAE
ncbi:MAG TPA: hypothetical protein VGG83_04840 [Trebonia sp.]|jgi:hypothetical protein